MLATTVIPVKRLALSLSFTLACTALGTPGAAHGTEVRIDHQDGTGTQTIIDVEPSIPGIRNFIRTTPAPIPQPGEVIVPPSATPEPSPAPTRVRRY